MTPEQKLQFEQMSRELAEIKELLSAPADATFGAEFDNVPVVKTWTSGSAATNGYLTVRIKGKTYKIQTRA